MPPKSKSKKAATSASKRKGKALKKKAQTVEATSETEWTTGDEEEPSLRHMVENLGALLTTLTSKMQDMEQRCDPRETAAVAHTLYAGPTATTSSQEAEGQAALPMHALPVMRAHPDVADEVCVQVAQRINAAPALFPLTDEYTESDNEDHTRRGRWKAMKSVKIRTTDLYVTKRVRCRTKWSEQLRASPPSTST